MINSPLYAPIISIATAEAFVQFATKRKKGSYAGYMGETKRKKPTVIKKCTPKLFV